MYIVQEMGLKGWMMEWLIKCWLYGRLFQVMTIQVTWKKRTAERILLDFSKKILKQFFSTLSNQVGFESKSKKKKTMQNGNNILQLTI